MFEIESNDGFADRIREDSQSYAQLVSEPDFVKFLDCTFRPHSRAGCDSGAFIVASYLEALKFVSGDFSRMDDDGIVSGIYDKASPNADGYISASAGMQVVADVMNSGSSVQYRTVYTLSSQFVKQFLHRYSFALIELKANSAYCSQDSSGFVGKWKIAADGDILDSRLSKGFLCVGYDSYGAVLMNSLGTAYGQFGFVKLSWDVFGSNFIKASAVSEL